MRDREPLKCRECGRDYTITHIVIEIGHSFVKPGSWYVPAPAQHSWSADCGHCEPIVAAREWGLYHLLGY